MTVSFISLSAHPTTKHCPLATYILYVSNAKPPFYCHISEILLRADSLYFEVLEPWHLWPTLCPPEPILVSDYSKPPFVFPWCPVWNIRDASWPIHGSLLRLVHDYTLILVLPAFHSFKGHVFDFCQSDQGPISYQIYTLYTSQVDWSFTYSSLSSFVYKTAFIPSVSSACIIIFEHCTSGLGSTLHWQNRWSDWSDYPGCWGA